MLWLKGAIIEIKKDSKYGEMHVQYLPIILRPEGLWSVPAGQLSMLYVLAREFDTRFMEHGPSFLSPYIQDQGHSYGFKDWIHLAIWLHVLVNQSGF